MSFSRNAKLRRDKRLRQLAAAPLTMDYTAGPDGLRSLISL